jgi:hypothetical protein
LGVDEIEVKVGGTFVLIERGYVDGVCDLDVVEMDDMRWTDGIVACCAGIERWWTDTAP